jgi:hypothetical protein
MKQWPNFMETLSTRKIPFVDFDVERLLPHMLSREGPCLAAGDVNGDGRQDFFMGGAAGEEGKIFLQKSGGDFEQSAQPVLVKDKELEDAAAVFFDVDNDGDQDLLVGSGGYQYDAGSSLLRARLYLNDGKAHFTEGQSINNVSLNAGCMPCLMLTRTVTWMYSLAAGRYQGNMANLREVFYCITRKEN